MNIKQIESTFSTRIYSNSSQTISFVCELDETDNIQECFDYLHQKAGECLGNDYIEENNRRYELRQEVTDLEAKLSKAQAAWNETAEFLRKQGINPNAPSFPFNKLLPGAEVAEAEFDDDDVM